jgi:hypothetical protein
MMVIIIRNAPILNSPFINCAPNPGEEMDATGVCQANGMSGYNGVSFESPYADKSTLIYYFRPQYDCRKEIILQELTTKYYEVTSPTEIFEPTPNVFLTEENFSNYLLSVQIKCQFFSSLFFFLSKLTLLTQHYD